MSFFSSIFLYTWFIPQSRYQVLHKSLKASGGTYGTFLTGFAVRPEMKISSIFLKLSTFEGVFFHILMGKTNTKLDFLYIHCNIQKVLFCFGQPKTSTNLKFCFIKIIFRGTLYTMTLLVQMRQHLKWAAITFQNRASGRKMCWAERSDAHTWFITHYVLPFEVRMGF